MESVKTIIDTCTNILTIEINLFGYSISLMAVIVFTGCCYLILKFVFKLFE